jgi:cellulose/xylan binding protein with CBM9 domain
MLLFTALFSIVQFPPLRAPAEEPPRYGVRFCETPPRVDGKLEEAAWKGAEAIRLVFPWESQTGPRTETVVRLLWDETYLYVGYECEDTDIVAHHEDRDDPVYEEDCVEIFVNPNPDKSDDYYGFEMSCRAVLYDYFYCFPEYILKQVNLSGVCLASHLDGTLNVSGDSDKGWSVEVSIPFAGFRDVVGDSPAPRPGDVWRAQVNRWEGTDPDRILSMWVPSGLENPHPHRPDRFGYLVFEK